MEATIVTVSAGVNTSLLEKLHSLKLKVSGQREKSDIDSLQRELAILSGALQDSEMMKARNMQDQEWARQVREVAYDIDDCIDLYQHNHLRSKSGSNILSPKRLFNRLDYGGFQEQIKRLLDRVVQVSERRERFKLAVTKAPRTDASIATAAAAHRGSSSGSATIDPQLFTMAGDPVAIGRPTKELVKFLDDDKKTRHVKVASIVGMAGIGKTTLALQVYRALEDRFQTRAFVRVGPRPSVTTVLLNIISQVTDKPLKHEDTPAGELGALLELREILRERRYLVVVDDIWSISAWKAINCALPPNSTGSRIIVTTRVHDVARSCSNHPSDINYEMEVLREDDSIRLFHRRIFGSEDKCQKSECSQIHGIILRICGGLPWTINAVASLLAMKEPKEWMMVIESTLLSALEQPPQWESIEKVLHLSYTDLPLSIKTCLLYLSVFPKNYEINKDRLIWRWIAEGFVPRISGDEGVWETGKSYFNQLINRSLIQLIVNDDDINEDDPTGCMVHDIIRDFVMSLSIEENFVTSDELDSRPRDVIRRLSLNYNNQETQSTMFELLESRSVDLSQARSLTILGRPPRMRHTLSSFLLLRVLDLEDAEGLDNADLDDIGRLFNLRYLGLGGKRITMLPDGIRNLQLLETLEIRRTEVRELPPGTGQLQKLVRLLAKALDVIPAGELWKMKELQELSVVSVNSNRALNLLNELTMVVRLRILEIKWGLREQDSGIQGCKTQFLAFLNRASKSNVKSLSIYCDEACSIDFVADSWDPHPPYLLQKLVMDRSEQCFCRIPKTLACCQALTYLEIAINLDVEEDILIIADLPSLTSLKLSARGKPIVISRQGFQCLKLFWFQRREGDLGLLFKEGATPQLRKLSLHFNVLPRQPQLQPETENQHGGRFVSGLQHLSSLKQVNVKIDCDGATQTDVASVEAAIQKEMHVDGRKFKLVLARENGDKIKRDGGEN